jgi:hypothetical protein
VLGRAALILIALALAACNDDLSDDAYGFIDLSPYYYDGSSATDPTAGLPRTIAPARGWMAGTRAEYYDFGLVGFVKKRSSGKLPDYASAPPMYFFFDSAGRPLFSRPVYEKRTGQWFMRGGLPGRDPTGPRDPNPREDASRSVPYAVRVRDYLIDKDRQSSEFQRPIIDRLQSNADYSGVWEIWEVIVADDYKPDSIKQVATLNRAVEAGKVTLQRTQTVINCPVLDDRQTVTPTPLWYGIPHPRIDIWYRTKLASCFLADGWLALGDAGGNLYRAGDPHRLNMFDVTAYSVGEGPSKRVTVTVPVQKMYVPAVTVASQDPTKTAVSIRYVNDNVTDAGPRYAPDQAPGYSPLRWLWDYKVPQDPPYQPGTYKRSDLMDPINMVNRLSSDTPFVKNFPLVGLNRHCASDADCTADKVPSAPGVKLECNKWPDAEIATGDVEGAGPAADDPARGRLMESREGGARCDVPAVRFGEFCAPGIARCRLDLAGTPDAKPMIDGKTPPAAMLGYTCQPQGTGYCYYRCDIDAGFGDTPKMPITVAYRGPGGTMKEDKTGALEFDARCGNMPGYRCLNPAPKMPAVPTRMRVCLRGCDTGKPDTYNDVYCQLPANMSINEKVSGNVNVQKGMKCSNAGIDPQTGVALSAAGCQWDPGYEPRDPGASFTPQ